MADSRPAPFQSSDTPRRTVLRGAAGLVLAWMTPIRAAAAAQSASEAPPAAGDLLVRHGDTSLIPLTPDDVPFDGRGMMAWALQPQGDVLKNGLPLHRIILARLNPARMSGPTAERSVDGVVAYSAICTHSGCEVDEAVGEGETIFCSCHGSSFDPRDSGTVIGGPAGRSLPALPLKLDGGRLVVAGGFTTPPGFGPGR
jgi:nitrite reductase/ring-hydroxylating ferredoxin subunit